MKLTRRQLKRIIKEEFDKTYSEYGMRISQLLTDKNINANAKQAIEELLEISQDIAKRVNNLEGQRKS